MPDTIACIGWGSLVWDGRDLPVDSEWHHDGPVLPIEFARHSGQGTGKDKLTLVLLESGSLITTRWAKLKVSGLEEARKALKLREGCKSTDIGYWPGGPLHAGGRIAEWANGKGLTGVVWTALPAKFGDEGRAPTLAEATAFLSALPEQSCALAEEYVRNAPLAVQTPYRTAFEKKFGWIPLATE
jgi:hypothetical protein